MKKRIIWSNRDINPEDYQEAYKEHLELNDIDASRYRLWDFVDDDLQNWFECEQTNLNIPTDGRILVIADIGAWDGRHQGYRIGTSRRNINEIFDRHYDYTEWYSDGYNIRAIDVHHDGVNYYEFREIREDRNIQNLLDAIYNGEKIGRKKLNYYTKSLHPYVAKVYGW
jgi:hypothetical protein